MAKMIQYSTPEWFALLDGVRLLVYAPTSDNHPLGLSRDKQVQEKQVWEGKGIVMVSGLGV